MKKQRIDPKLGKIFDQIIEQYDGLPDSTNTKMMEWIYNWIGERGFNQSPYLNKLRLPAYPLTTRLLHDYGLPSEMLKRTKRGNKYLAYQFERMKKAKQEGNAKLYWAIAEGLIRRSTYFRMVFLNKACPGWYYNKDWGYILKKMKQMKNLWKSTRVNVKRIYITKANGKLRPIGAPEKEWNAHLGQWAWALGYWIENKLDNRQHGFQPKKGLWSAWTEFLTRVKGKANIVEYDLSKYFNTIRLRTHAMWDITTEFLGRETFYNSMPIKSLEEALKKLKVPAKTVDHILRQNEETRPRVEKIEDYRDPELWTKDLGIAKFKRVGKGRSKRLKNSKNYEDSPGIITIPESNIANGQQVVWTDPQTIYLDLPEMTVQHRDNWTDKSASYVGENCIPEFYGLTQGSPTSPVLANIFMDHWGLLSQPKLRVFENQSKTYRCRSQSYNRYQTFTANKELGGITGFRTLEETSFQMYEETGFRMHYMTEGWDGIQYADDGILCSENKPAERLMQHLKFKENQVYGTKINWEKTHVVRDRGIWKRKVKFLGSTYDPWSETLQGPGDQNPIPITKVNSENIYKIVGNTYGRQDLKDWRWVIQPNSWLGMLDNRKSVGRPSKEGIKEMEQSLMREKKDHPYLREMSTVITSLVLGYMRQTKYQGTMIKCRKQGRPNQALERRELEMKLRRMALIVKKEPKVMTTKG